MAALGARAVRVWRLMRLGSVRLGILVSVGLGMTLSVSHQTMARAQSDSLSITGGLNDTLLSQIVGEISAALDNQVLSPVAAAPETLAREADGLPSVSCAEAGRNLATASDLELTASMVSLLSQKIIDQLATAPACSVEARSGVLSVANTLATVNFAPVERAATCSGVDDGVAAEAARVLAQRNDLQSKIRDADEACAG